MDILVNGIMKTLDYIKVREYLQRMIYDPDDLDKILKKELKRCEEVFDVRASQIKNRRKMLATLEELIKTEEKIKLQNRENYTQQFEKIANL